MKVAMEQIMLQMTQPNVHLLHTRSFCVQTSSDIQTRYDVILAKEWVTFEEIVIIKMHMKGREVHEEILPILVSFAYENERSQMNLIDIQDDSMKKEV